MASLTRHPRNETIRKLGAGLALALLSACATSGPNHVYLITANAPAIHDLGGTNATIGGILAAGEQARGLAYDFNTDHLFVRVTPAQVIRVVERPSGKILRNMPLPPELRTDQAADLAIRSSDRHLFAVHPDGRSVVELTLSGEFIRRLELTNLDAPIGGLAFDQKHGRLLVLTKSTPARIAWVGPGGSVTYYVTLSSAVTPTSLGYDSAAQHFFVPLGDARALGEFDAAGKLRSTQATDGPVTGIAAGPRSFIRVF